jgi:hypothetical protein
MKSDESIGSRALQVKSDSPQRRGGSAEVHREEETPFDLRTSALPPRLCGESRVAISVFVFFCVFYTAFQSNRYTAVDGPLRSLQIYFSPELFLHGNNHLLYPLFVSLWHWLSGLFGRQATDALSYLQLTQTMNAFAAGGVLAILYRLLRALSGSRAIALGLTVAAGFSKAFLMHATNAAEPVIGLFFSILAVGVMARALCSGTVWLLPVSGALITLAMSTYQSMVLIAPGMAALALLWPENRPTLQIDVAGIKRLGWFLLGAVLGGTTLYGSILSFTGLRRIDHGPVKVFGIDYGAELFGGLSLSKIINTPLGLIGNLAPVADQYRGLRRFLTEDAQPGELLFGLYMSLLVYGFLIRLSLRALRHDGASTAADRCIQIALLTAGAFTVAAPLFWEPFYDKLWLQPILLLVLFCASCFRQTRSRSIVIMGVLIVVLLAASTLVRRAIPDHFRKPESVAEARAVREQLKPGDLLICDWDSVSMLYMAFYGHEGRLVCLPAIGAPSIAAQALQELKEDIRRTQAAGANVYFLGTLDLTAGQWKDFLGDRMKIEYREFEPYRRAAEMVRKFQLENGGVVTLRRLAGEG